MSLGDKSDVFERELRKRRPPVETRNDQEPPGKPGSVFAGVGWLTAWDPLAAIGLPGEWVAVRPDLCSPEQADAIRKDRKRLVIWEAIDPDRGRHDLFGQVMIDKLGAVGWIPQDEHMEDRAAALRALERGISVEWAFCTNNHAPHDGRPVLVEAYWNANPKAVPGAVAFDAVQLGGKVQGVVFGMYDAEEEKRGRGDDGRLIPLDQYLDAWRDDWSGYLAEYARLPEHEQGLARL